MSKRFVRIMAIIALVAFVAVSFISVYPVFTVNAETAQQKLDRAVKQKGELNTKIKHAKSEKSDKLAQKNSIDVEISQLQGKINELSAKISNSNTKIEQKQAELTKAQEESAEQYEAYYSRAKMLIERGSITYLEVLLNANSFSDLLSRISIVKQIAKYDSNRLNELKLVEQQIAAIKSELEAEKNSLVALKSENDSQMSTLKQKQAASQKIIDDLSADIASYEAALKKQEQAEAAAREEIRKLSVQTSQSKVFVGGTFTWPSVSSTITSPYGTRVHPITGKVRRHAGVDIGASYGTNIYAANSGTVIVAGWNSGGYGNYVVIDHGGGYTTLYGHCSSLLVSKGQTVTKGQVIAKVGSTGMSSGPHLHFEVLVNGSTTNPMSYFN